MSLISNALQAPTITNSQVKEAEKKEHEFQKFLDDKQYTKRGIELYEEIIGIGFISAGGIETTKVLVKLLELENGDRVLDVGCGIGGNAFHMARQGAHVTGVDLSKNMLNHAIKTQPEELKDLLTFELTDITTKEFPPESFDVMYSRDTLLHIEDKLSLFQKMLNWLKPGGKLLITDYCQGAGKLSEDFIAYREQRGYQLTDPKSYGELLVKAGFKDVNAEDKTEGFVNILKSELKRVKANESAFVAKHGRDGYEKIVKGWEAKLVRCAAGDQKWGVFQAVKAA